VAAGGKDLDQSAARMLIEIFARSRDVVLRYSLAPRLGFEYVSPGVVDLLGYTPSEHYADPLLHLHIVHPEDRPVLEQLIRGPESISTPPVIRFIHKDGSTRFTEPNLVLVRDESGAPQWLGGVVRDVSRREEDARRLEIVQERARGGDPEPRPAVRVLIVDDHQLTRVGLRAVLARDSEFLIVGEASNGREAVEMTTELQPDLVLMDVRMPDMDGLAATRNLKQSSPMTSVLLLSMFDDPDLLVAAVDAGAAGYALKDASLVELEHAIREVLSGGFPVDNRLAREALVRLARQKTGAQSAPTPLSSRELEVLRLLAQGSTNREIGEVLTIAPYTVKVHVEHIFAKLGVSDRTQAAVRAIELGLFTPGRGA
jgi:PAS domain S-box-containing protein